MLPGDGAPTMDLAVKKQFFTKESSLWLRVTENTHWKVDTSFKFIGLPYDKFDIEHHFNKLKKQNATNSMEKKI